MKSSFIKSFAKKQEISSNHSFFDSTVRPNLFSTVHVFWVVCPFFMIYKCEFFHLCTIFIEVFYAELWIINIAWNWIDRSGFFYIHQIDGKISFLVDPRAHNIFVKLHNGFWFDENFVKLMGERSIPWRATGFQV